MNRKQAPVPSFDLLADAKVHLVAVRGRRLVSETFLLLLDAVGARTVGVLRGGFRVARAKLPFPRMDLYHRFV